MDSISPRKMGKPRILDDIKSKVICDVIESGGSRKQAADAANVSVCQLQLWIKKGRETDDKMYTDFASKVQRADAKAEGRMVQAIVYAATCEKPSWQAAAWWLERARGKWWPRPPDFIKGKHTKDNEDMLHKASLEELIEAAAEHPEIKKRANG